MSNFEKATTVLHFLGDLAQAWLPLVLAVAVAVVLVEVANGILDRRRRRAALRRAVARTSALLAQARAHR